MVINNIFEAKNLICLVPILAIAFDTIIGDPPNQWHPVAWIGNIILKFKHIAPKRGKLIPLLASAIFLLLSLSIIGYIVFLIVKLIHILPFTLTLVLEALLLKLTLPVRGLKKAGIEVYNALKDGNINEARRLVAWHLVSRKTDSLDEGHVVSATVESVAENLADGVVGPIFWWILLGLPGAWIYRFINTSDSILGYRTDELEWLGKIPARLDDIANFIPSRLSAFFLILSAVFMKINPIHGIYTMFRDYRITSSPNAGFPMSAMAGLLNIKLEKIGNYCLNKEAELPSFEDINRSIMLMQISAWISAIIGFLRLLLM